MAQSESGGCVGRIMHSFVGVLFGVVLFLGSFVLLGWNEYDAVRQTGAITELERIAIADVSAESVNDANEGRLVHIANAAVSEDELEYRVFGVREQAIHLRWNSSIYQWVEEERKQDDRTTYEYHQEWVDQPINSDHFRKHGYSNTGTKHFQDGSVQATNVRFGAFRLTTDLIRQIDNEQLFPLPPTIVSDVRPRGEVHEGIFYTGNPDNPEIGDELVEVYIVPPRQDVTVMAQQSQNTFQAYRTKVGISKSLLYLGRLSKDQVIAKQRTEAAIRRWAFRALGFILMWVGLALVFGPIRAIFSFIPFVSRLLEGAIGFVTFFFAAGLTMLTIALAWFAVRPILAIVLIVLAAFALVVAYRARSQAPATATSTPPPLPG